MDPVTDPHTDSIDREIARALAVDPSPEFVARVRARIAETPAPAPWGFRWMCGAVVVAATLAIAVVMMRPEPPVAPQGPTLLASRAIELTAVVPNGGPPKGGHYRSVESPTPASPTPVVSGFSRTVASRTEPAVLFDSREVSALQRLVAAPIAVAAERPAMDLAPVDTIVIPPLAIEPLGPSGQGERQ